METSKTNIIPLSPLIDYSIIDYRHLESLLAPYNGERNDKVLVEWLGFFNEYEQLHNDFSSNEYLTRNNSQMETDNQSEFNEQEEEEEEERRRDDLDMEEYEDFSSSVVSKSHTSTVNHMDIESNTRKSNHIHRFIEYLNKNPTTLNDEIVKHITHDLWKLSDIDRYNLYGYWLLKYRQHLDFSVNNVSLDYNHTVSNLDKCRQEADYHILKDSIIVAMTTTCAAKYHKILENLRKKSFHFNKSIYFNF